MTYTAKQNTWYLVKNMWKWDKLLFFLSTLQGPLTVLVALIGIYIPKLILDSIVMGLSFQMLVVKMMFPVLGLMVFSVLNTAIGQWVWMRKINYRMRYTLLLTSKGLHTDYENIDGANGQERYQLASMATTSNSSSAEKVVLVLVSLVSNTIGFILYAGIIATLHPLIVAFVVVSAMVNLYGGRRVNRYIESNKEHLADARRKLNYIGKTGGDFKAAKDLRLYGTGHWFKDNYAVYLKKRVSITVKNDLRKLWLSFMDGGMVLVRDVITYGVLVAAVLQKGLSIGDFALYFGAVAGISHWLSGMAKDMIDIDAMSLETQHLRHYLEMPEHHNRGIGQSIPPHSQWPLDIAFIDVSFRYPGAEKDTISHVNLHIKKGEKLALVGVNGAGKTTLVKLLCGLYRPTQGEIRINGVPMQEYNIHEYYKLFSVVFQDYFILPMSIEENIALKKSSEMTDMEAQHVNQLIEQVGLGKKVKSLPAGKKSMLVKSVHVDAAELSGGEYQKLMLAQALYKAAPIMVLDEPTAALDPIAENEIYQQYNEMTKTSTSIFISHRLSSTRFCDRIVFLEGGKIVEMGSHDTLMQGDTRYKHMYDKQSHYYKKGGEASA